MINPYFKKSLLLAALTAVPTESTGRCKLAELVADHIFRYEHFDVSLAVVNHEGRSNELWNDRASTRPSSDRLTVTLFTRLQQLCEQLGLYERPLFCRTSHLLCAPDRYLNFN